MVKSNNLPIAFDTFQYSRDENKKKNMLDNIFLILRFDF